MNFYSMNICNFRTQHGMALYTLPTKVTAFQDSWCSFCVTSMPVPRIFSAWACVCFAKK